jgi:cell wall-associated NlpC family hydrolase
MAGQPPPDWVAPYIGLPWRTMGRDRSGLDCWGLLRLVFSERWDIDLPEYGEGGWKEQRKPADFAALAQFIHGRMTEDWKSVGWVGRREGDGVLFMVRGRPLHIGLVVAPDWFLHIQAGHDAAVERFDSAAWRGRVEGAYRHRLMLRAAPVVGA